ncbi:hypothetical protein PG993_008620 [Apiospora rasikravindrae]|uniref:ApaG domain-containing protein n=1 Tax=Apiospora rasikravindrae TaxID=990691 RepID=A0ABR1T0V4_9PEZI
MSHPFQSDDDAFALGDAERLHLLRAKWPVFENEDGYAPGFDAFVVLLRHIYSFLPTGAPPEYGDESLEVLQVARKPIHDGNVGLVRVCKQSALSELVDDPKTDFGSLRFESLVKNPRVIEKLWSRHYYLLYSTTVLALAPSSQEWVVDEPYETRNVALESLFQWDGTRPLGESLSTLFGIFRHPATGWRYLRLPNMPITIRVLYDPNADELLNPPDFAQVRSFHITAKDCEPVDDEKKSFVLKETKCQYRLVASVDLETDTVRLYGINGAYIPPPHDHGELVSSRGSIGDLGRRYMLFFARTSDDVPPQVQNSLEVIEMPAFAPEEEGGFDLPPETNEQSDDDDGNDDENDGKTQPTKQPGFRIEDDGPTFTLGIIQQSAPALNLEDDALELALKTVPVPTASAMNQYSDDEDEVEDEEDEPEDTEMANVHPDRRPSTVVPPTHDSRRSDHRAPPQAFSISASAIT